MTNISLVEPLRNGCLSQRHTQPDSLHYVGKDPYASRRLKELSK
jgi:hypothetical protein